MPSQKSKNVKVEFAECDAKDKNKVYSAGKIKKDEPNSLKFLNK
jgi:hypothetical protein